MPDWRQRLREHLRLPAMHGLREERAIEELHDHLEDLYHEQLAQGASPGEAEERALQALGEASLARRDLVRAEPRRRRAATHRWLTEREETGRRRGGGWSALADLSREMRWTVRSLGRRPGYSLAVVLVLALGLGGAATVFTVVDRVLLSPLPYAEQHRLVAISHSAPEAGFDDAGQCAAWHRTYEDSSTSLSSIGLYSGSSVTVNGLGDPQSVPALLATHGVFEALRIQPLVGRRFLAEDELPRAAPVAVLVEEFWLRQFGGDPAAIGRQIEVDGVQHEIVGVVPRALAEIVQGADLVLPFEIDESRLYVGNIGFGSVARLGQGVSMETARQELETLLPSAWERYPGGPLASAATRAAFSVRLVSLKERLVGPVAPLLWVLLAGVSLVLLVACANAASLFLVRQDERLGEFVLRNALGASALRIHWERLKESLLLAAAGAAVAMVLTQVSVAQLSRLLPPELQFSEGFSPGSRTFLITVFVAMTCGVVMGLLPALRGAGGATPSGSRSARVTSGVSERLLLRGVAGSQMTLVFVLLVAAGLMLRSSRNLSLVEPGFHGADEVLGMRLQVPVGDVPELAEAASQLQQIVERVERISGVESATVATSIPMDGENNVNNFYAETPTHREFAAGEDTAVIQRHKWVGGNYFSTLEIPLLAGREIEWADVHERRPTAVVSASLAREYWGSVEAALGQHVAARPEPTHWFEVVGVAADVREDGLGWQEPAMVYWPHVTYGFWRGSSADSVMAWRDNAIALRTRRLGNPRLMDEVRAAIWEVNPRLPVTRVAALEDLLAASTANTAFLTTLLLVAGALATVLGLFGTYGLISNTVRQQENEIGIRRALGASGNRIRFDLLRQGLWVSLAGLAPGLALVCAFGALVESVLYDVRATDPLTVVCAAVALVAVVLLASYLPARRAAAIDPIQALRAE